MLPSKTHFSIVNQDMTSEYSTDSPSMGKLEFRSATTLSRPFSPPPPDNPWDLDVGITPPASAYYQGSPGLDTSEVKELISHVNISEHLLSLNTSQHGYSKDASAGPPTPKDSKHPQVRHDEIQSPSPHELNEGFYSMHFAKFMRVNNRLIEEQQTVSAKRSKVRELRQALRFKREEEAILRATLMKKLNSLFAQNGPPPVHSMIQDYELLQSATEAYLDLENTYHDAEDQLEQQEYQLVKSMEKFAALSHKLPYVTAQEHLLASEKCDLEEEEEDDDDDDDDDENFSMPSTTQDLPQGVVDYLSRVGDVRILQEHLLDLDTQWLAIMDKQKQRGPLEIPLDSESLEFLRTYDEEREKMLKDLNNAQLDVNQLRSMCEEKGVLTDEYARDLDFLYPLDQEEFTGQEHDPLKLPADEDSSFFFEPEAMAQLTPTRFINKWILHQLRNSSVEIHRLKSRPELQALWDKGLMTQAYHHDQPALSIWMKITAT
ncbi:hypothetical protein EYZ11_004464 [Aspergillus tanneri]|uniref:Uncharacterized protein n=1 Tax=Aspergillus tanneri TaxID=1220188 RepID=A0A4S3JKQ8_9EURO|nr:hypothetical protein EYZ11_004464 [Aspergillus tanneri]